MTKEVLEQYTSIRNEERDIMRRIESLNARILNMEVNNIVSDTVTKGRHNRKPLGVVRIEGFPSREYQRKKHHLRSLKKQLALKDEELLKKMAEVEKYIEHIQDSRIRRIMRYRFLDDMSWIQIAHEMKEAESSPRMAVERYLAEEK